VNWKKSWLANSFVAILRLKFRFAEILSSPRPGGGFPEVLPPEPSQAPGLAQAALFRHAQFADEAPVHLVRDRQGQGVPNMPLTQSIDRLTLNGLNHPVD
jgi:hypothetical protein